ncbi:H-NS family nucleoid-associated regulatory protein [Aeromonas caviae]|jgi:DNA-binding protein H-NS|uniref:DNA-binding protein n=2 Tax=Aeromonas caviae TaxID=648 RepID=A0A2X4NID6_AERCA|nr:MULTISPECIES: H-NS family nucleoid-associated regulatory protein [Aeromonas]MCR6555200.1 H-NS histone family protein [Aeromonas sp. CPF2-S1]PZQ93406.1 MAG: transcriptional regulator [Aeromonas media]AUU21222.1 transcriptional regulator [Aeromonas caviae]AUV12882.1 transcriptional regulator [Aeromonas sp. ASNIH3]AUZ81870.1 transcriptional regulator [Aeromonas sp. ASNIH1]
MNEFLKVLLNIRSLRAACRDLTLEQLEEGLEKLSAIVDERRQDESAERQAREEHQKKIAEYAEMLKAAGIDPAELVNTVVPENTKVSKRAPRPAKYRYLDNGVEKTWTGQGRMPSVIAKAVAEGKSVEAFAI